MREFLKAMSSFSWAMSLFGVKTLENVLTQRPDQPQDQAACALDAVASAAKQQLGSELRTLFERGDQLQRGMIDQLLSDLPAAPSVPGRAPLLASVAQPAPNAPQSAIRTPAGGHAGETASERREPDAMAHAPLSRHVKLVNQTQGPFWPPSEIMDEEGNFVVVGGFLLQEVALGTIAPVPNKTGAIVSKDTVPPLRDGKEDFSNPFGAPYQIVRQLDLAPGSKDHELILHSLSAGPFVGDDGGFPPRQPGGGDSPYNLNSNPRWNRWIAPVGADAPDYYRPSYPLHQVPVWRMQDIPDDVPIGVRVEPGRADARLGVANQRDDFRRMRRPITLGDYLRGKGDLQITPMRAQRDAGGFTHARFDFTFQAMLPHSIYGVWVLRARTLLPTTTPNFLLPTPLAIPNMFITDGEGNATVSFLIRNPFPDPSVDPQGNRMQALAVTYLSDFQNWGAAFTSIGTGADAHTAMAANVSNLTDLITIEP